MQLQGGLAKEQKQRKPWEIEKRGNGKDEDVTLTGMQTHVARCQKSLVNKGSGWNLVYVAEE